MQKKQPIKYIAEMFVNHGHGACNCYLKLTRCSDAQFICGGVLDNNAEREAVKLMKKARWRQSSNCRIFSTEHELNSSEFDRISSEYANTEHYYY